MKALLLLLAMLAGSANAQSHRHDPILNRGGGWTETCFGSLPYPIRYSYIDSIDEGVIDLDRVQAFVNGDVTEVVIFFGPGRHAALDVWILTEGEWRISGGPSVRPGKTEDVER